MRILRFDLKARFDNEQRKHAKVALVFDSDKNNAAMTAMSVRIPRHYHGSAKVKGVVPVDADGTYEVSGTIIANTRGSGEAIVQKE